MTPTPPSGPPGAGAGLSDEDVRNPRDMSEAEAREFFATFFFGEHHIPGKLRPWGDGWYVRTHADLSTFDFDGLSRLVFLAHDRCVRVEVTASGPGHLAIAITKRVREGAMYERHPTLEHAIALFRSDPHEPNPNITLDGETRKRIAELERERDQAKADALRVLALWGVPVGEMIWNVGMHDDGLIDRMQSYAEKKP
jgi:hypothetical protein